MRFVGGLGGVCRRVGWCLYEGWMRFVGGLYEVCRRVVPGNVGVTCAVMFVEGDDLF